MTQPKAAERRQLTDAQLKAAERLAYWLNKAPDADLAGVGARLRVVIFDIPEIKNATYIGDAVAGRARRPLSAETSILIDMISMIERETDRRQAVLHNAEADLRGGHWTSVCIGDDPEKFQGWCGPVWDGPSCWEGPDRETIEEAVSDALAHHPEFEPSVPDGL